MHAAYVAHGSKQIAKDNHHKFHGKSVDIHVHPAKDAVIDVSVKRDGRAANVGVPNTTESTKKHNDKHEKVEIHVGTNRLGGNQVKHTGHC